MPELTSRKRQGRNSRFLNETKDMFLKEKSARVFFLRTRSLAYILAAIFNV